MTSKREKAGQTQLSFGMIFSIILIIFFIAFAIYGITKFMDAANYTKVESFKIDFQADIDNMWKSHSGLQEVDYILPKKIKEVCFVNNEDENMYFLPEELEYSGKLLRNVDIAESTRTSPGRKLCIPTSNGKFSLTIKISYGNDLVTIKR